MTGIEKQIYNSWLAITRTQQNKPFKLRKDWTDFESREEYHYIKKLAKLFKTYDNINIDDWFKAPYIIYPEKIQYDLKSYTLMKQYNTYKLYLQKTNKRKYTPLEFKNTITKTKKS